MKRFRRVPSLVTRTALGALAPVGKTQSAVDAGSFASISGSTPSATHPHLDLAYRRATERTNIRNYLFDTFGPYPIAGGAILGALNPADQTPPEWGKGARAYGQRVGSNFSIATFTTTTCYALAGGNIARESIYGGDRTRCLGATSAPRLRERTR
jgi:hypothetical protein